MNETIRELMTRKSVRAFEEREIGAAEKEAILLAAVNAPTAGNQQLYTIIDVTDQQLKEQLSVSCDHQPFIAQGKMVLVFCADCRKWYRAFLDAGYLEVEPPVMVNEASGFGTGQLPDKEGQMYHATADNFYLVPTAEVPVTNIYRDVILCNNDFPVKMTAYTPCFRREAGSYGKDVRGLNRLHQFDKVEIVRIEKPEESYAALDEMIAHVEGLVKSLGLPYRILRLCGGDMSFTSAITYDFEVYSAAQGRWLEISSVSNFESYQANRLKLRYKDADGKTQLAHTLNGSSLALPRVVAALLENNQKGDRIEIPEALRPYTGFDYID